MTPVPEIARADIPVLTIEQMIEVDRAMMHDYDIELIQMVDNAARRLATWGCNVEICLTRAPAGKGFPLPSAI